MLNMVHSLRWYLVHATFTLVGAATLGLAVAGGQTAFAADPPSPIHPIISFTGVINGTQAQLAAGYDTPFTKIVNIDKTKNITAHLTIPNNTGRTQTIYDYFTLPGHYDSGYNNIYSFVSDSAAGQIELSPTSAQFSIGYSYVGWTNEPNEFTPTYSPNENLNDLYIGGPMSATGGANAKDLANNQTLNVSIPLRLSADYDFNLNHPAQFFNRLVWKNDDPTIGLLVYGSQFPINLIPVRSITAKDFSAASYSGLAISQNLGVATLYDADGNAVADKTQATVKSITPTNDPAKYTVIYSYDGVDSKPVTATITDDKTFIDAKDFTVAYGSNWDSQKFNGLTKHLGSDGNAVVKLSDGVQVATDKTVDTNNAGSTYNVTYTIDGISKTVKVTVGQRGATPSNNGGNSSSNANNNNSGNSGNNAWNPSNPSNPNGTGLPNYAAVKGGAIYATKRIYMYRNADFKKSQRIATYPKAKRVNRPMFVVLGYEKSNGGALRYKVRDVNHGTKNAGKIGYITANRNYVVNAYYQTMPSNNKITVLAKSVHAYKNESLNGRAKTYKKGTHLTVKKLVKHNLTTRYQLSNGYYVTANKKLVIQGNF